MSKNGIGFIGSVIVDEVTEILESGNLVYSDGSRYLQGGDAESEHITYGVGGLATNNSVNIATIGADYPLRVIGKIGADSNGRRIRDTLAGKGISDRYLLETADHPTSTTQVIYLRDSHGAINRTFRHFFGAMGDFKPEDVDISIIGDLKIVMLGYCLLMPHFDKPDDEYGAAAGRLLEQIHLSGVKTCVDFITPKRDRWWKFNRFRNMLRWVDILTVGEDQAEGLTGITDEEKAARALVEDYGVGVAVVHCGDHGINYLYSRSAGLISQSIFQVPPDEYAGNAGAGDAFASGLLHGMHQEWTPKRCLQFATAAAAVSLGSLTCTDSMRDESYLLEYMRTRPVV